MYPDVRVFFVSVDCFAPPQLCVSLRLRGSGDGCTAVSAPQGVQIVVDSSAHAAMADQLRWNAAVPTPALDRIAAEGVRVRFSWSSTPTCTPARAAILTGRRPWGHGQAPVSHEP